MPGLAIAVPELTLAHAEMLLPVPMDGRCPWPAMPIGWEDACEFPAGTIGHQHLVRCARVLVTPQQPEPHGLLALGPTHRFGEPLLGRAVDGDGLAGIFWQAGAPFAPLAFLPANRNRAVQLYGAHLHPLLAVDVVAPLGVGKVAGAGAGSGNVVCKYPITQRAGQCGVVGKRRALGLAGFPLAAATKRQWIVLARATHGVDA